MFSLPKGFVDPKTIEGLQFYRCDLCHGVVSKWDIEEHLGCGKCGGTRLRPSNLSLLEKLVQIVKHPLVWKWHGPL